MKIIGFDFGTTNSTISYYDTEAKRLENFKFGAQRLEYIPTIVSYKNQDVSIGDLAKKNLTSKGSETYEHFKLCLGKNAHDKIDNKSKTPTEVTQDFIKKLLNSYIKDQNIGEIKNLVMTVPATWDKEGSNRTAGENIEEIYKKLGYESSFQLESEPIAAATYFCWAYEDNKEKNPSGKKYKGFITVIDFGGGTLDITLCEVGDDIRIKENFGFGEHSETNGCAGVAFDNAVIKKLIQDNKLDIPMDSSHPKFIKLRNKFEESKIMESDKITKMLGYYYDDPDTVGDEELFSLDYNDDDEGTINVYCKDLDECFNEVNAPKLRESLEKIQQYYKENDINTSKQETFKVLLVGGFSNFFAVEKEVKTFFGSNTESIDKRFEEPFPKANRALSISRGASLIAAEWAKIVRECKHDYGYIKFGLGGKKLDEFIPYYHPIIKKNTNLEELAKPIFAEKSEIVKHEGGKLWIFIDKSDPIPLDGSIKELFPTMSDKDREFTIGFSVNKNNIPSIHIRDKHGAVHSTSLNRLIERIGI